jgi:competence protein ComGC
LPLKRGDYGRIEVIKCKDLLGFALVVAVVVMMVIVINTYLSVPIVQKDSVTREVVGVITSDGVEHPASYFLEHELDKGTYEVEWVRPLSLKEGLPDKL